MTPTNALTLADYRRTVAEMYATVRAAAPSRDTWSAWVDARDCLFQSHPQSAIAAGEREKFDGLSYFEHDSSFRFEAEIQPVTGPAIEIPHSAAGSTTFVPIGRVSLDPLGSNEILTVYWLDAYGGGLFLPFRDGTAGSTTYDGGRYLLDTVKGADLGGGPSRIVLDFNYAYHPSCVHNAQWSCPLAPQGNRVSLDIESGERLRKA